MASSPCIAAAARTAFFPILLVDELRSETHRIRISMAVRSDVSPFQFQRSCAVRNYAAEVTL